MTKLAGLISRDMNLSDTSIQSVLRLMEQGNTVPFLARYRKEQTGGLDEVQLRNILEKKKAFEELIHRKEYIKGRIAEQDALTEQLERKIENSWDRQVLEDLYLPYKSSRKTKADKAREKGLGPLAGAMKRGDRDLTRHIVQSMKSLSRKEQIDGVRDILAEEWNEYIPFRDTVRDIYIKYAQYRAKVVKGKEKEGKDFRNYFDHREHNRSIPSHRLLALHRGERKGILRVSLRPDDERSIKQLKRRFVKAGHPFRDTVEEALEDAYKRLTRPSIENEIRNLRKEEADEAAIDLFAQNLRQQLMTAPLGPVRVIGIDPGYRTGSKACVLDEQGKLLAHGVLDIHRSEEAEQEARSIVHHWIRDHEVEAFAVGDGTMGRETFSWCRQHFDTEACQIYMVSEQGASIYSASEIAREEWPDLDVSIRGAITIAKRLVDPLSEYVKLDPKHLGIGQYQHEVDEKKLKESLDTVVEDVVHSVGIDLNTAGPWLLQHISGFGPAMANRIVRYRNEEGAFTRREALKKVTGMGEKTYRLSVGFLRIRQSEHPLDNTAIHPESYGVVEQMAKDLGTTVSDLMDASELLDEIDMDEYTNEEIGRPTMQLILAELRKPGFDPRGKAEPPVFADNPSSFEDLKEGMTLPGTVSNITHFGAFVDLGLKDDGLIHKSNIDPEEGSVQPEEFFDLYDDVEVKIESLDEERRRIGLVFIKKLN